MKISIVTAYHNRKQLFYNTLKSISKSSIKDIEVVVVDDGSNEEHRLEDLTQEFPYLKIIRLEKKDKWYVNPCIPYNIGFKYATGDIIIIQNPECYHTSDILKYTLDNIDEETYIAFGCYSLDKEKTNLLTQNNTTNNPLDLVGPLIPSRIHIEGALGWYNHPTIRPVAYHFCSAITRSNLNKLNGFDERYAMGIGFDDNEILCRVKRIPLRVNITESPIVLHQNHYDEHYLAYSRPELASKNRDLYNNVTLNEKLVKAN